jgi:hypothetical protein
MWISVRLITEVSIVIVRRRNIAILPNPIHLGGVMVSVLVTSSEDVGIDDKNVDAFQEKPSSSTLYIDTSVIRRTDIHITSEH